MANYLTEDISISKGNFFRLFISYTLSFFFTIVAATIFILKIIGSYGLPIWIGTIAYIGTAIGGILVGILVSKKFPQWISWIIAIIYGITLNFGSILIGSTSFEIKLILIFVACLVPGTIMSVSSVYVGKLTKIEERGRVVGSLNVIGGLILLMLVLSTVYLDLSYQFIVLGCGYAITGVLNLIYTRDISIEIKESGNEIKEDIRKKDFIFYCLILFLVCIFWGVVMVYVCWGSIYSTVLQFSSAFFGVINFLVGTEFPLFLLSIESIVFSFFLGLIADKFGRKNIWLIAITSSIIAIFLYGVSQDMLSLAMGCFFLGITLPSILIGMVTFIADSTAPNRIWINFGCFFGLGWGLGLALGIQVGTFMIFYDFLFASFVLAFITACAYLMIVYTHETLPPKKERQWFSKLRQLYVINEGGINLFNYSFSPQKTDPLLVSGGISGLCTIVQELTMSESKLKVITQEKAIIILNHGSFVTSALIVSEDLKVLHRKLEIFTNEFEKFFGALFKSWVGDTSIFTPGQVIAERLFEIEKFEKIKNQK